jgi:hypothetical protein
MACSRSGFVAQLTNNLSPAGSLLTGRTFPCTRLRTRRTVTVGDKQVACSCCFTIRRDVFDLPSVVIGQFLPIPLELRS